MSLPDTAVVSSTKETARARKIVISEDNEMDFVIGLVNKFCEESKADSANIKFPNQDLESANIHISSLGQFIEKEKLKEAGRIDIEFGGTTIHVVGNTYETFKALGLELPEGESNINTALAKSKLNESQTPTIAILDNELNQPPSSSPFPENLKHNSILGIAFGATNYPQDKIILSSSGGGNFFTEIIPKLIIKQNYKGDYDFSAIPLAFSEMENHKKPVEKTWAKIQEVLGRDKFSLIP